MEIRLDKETFKALASTTRIDVLKLLAQRRHMQSELAASLGFSVPTVKEHLSALEKAGLIERHEEGRKWKYYSLTKKGKGVLNPEEMKIWIVLGMLVFSVVGGLFTAVQTVFTAGTAKMAMQAEAMELEAVRAVPPPPEPQFSLPIFFAVVTIVLVMVLIYFLVRSAQYKKQLGKSLTKK